MRACGLAVIAVVAVVCAVSATSSAAVLYAISADNYLTSFDSASPGTILDSRPITGLAASEKVVGLDFWTDGKMYGLGDSSRLYTIDPATGAATAVSAGQFSPLLDSTAWGFDNTPDGAAVIGDLGQSLTLNRATGAAGSNPSVAPATHVTALAYAADSNTLYGIDSNSDQLVTVNVATGVATPVGALGIDSSRLNGFDIGDGGIAYLATPAASSDPAANLYTVNLGTGAVTLVGLIGATNDNLLFRGLTVIPEPATLGLLALGGLLIIARRRSRKS